jgi:hypothetical protein
VTGGIAMKKNDDIEAGCPDNTCPAGEDWSDVIQSRDALGVTSTVLLATGAAALAAGTVMIIVSHKKRPERFSFSPVLSPDLAGAALKWRF